MTKQHWISKTKLRDTKWQSREEMLGDGQVRLKLDAFALTSNNATYAAFGGAPLFYWNFFPTGDEEWGRVPVWGFATVAESNVDAISPGRRVYGYFPISESLIVEPAKIDAAKFVDGAAHRLPMSPIYNQYSFNDHDPAYVEGTEAEQMLFRPLYQTGWMICDCIVQSAPAIQTAVISSASSKTALATAQGLQNKGVKTIGLTSAGNLEYVKGSDLYDQVLTYDDVANTETEGNAAYIDFTGRPALTKAVHDACGMALTRSLIIGATDWEADKTPPVDMPGPQPEFFFVPDYIAGRLKETKPGDLLGAMMVDLKTFYTASHKFVTPEVVQGPDNIDQAWRDTVDGKVAPQRGLICKF